MKRLGILLMALFPFLKVAAQTNEYGKGSIQVDRILCEKMEIETGEESEEVNSNLQ